MIWAVDGPKLTPHVYEELRTIARRVRGPANAPTSLDPTELVHEAWAKISRSRRSAFEDRAQFVALAARAMRQILVDQARYQGANKRGGDVSHATLPSIPDLAGKPIVLVELDKVLERLERLDDKAAAIFVVRAFGGLTLDETADALGVSRRTAARKWRYARAFVARKLDLDSLGG